MGTRYIIAVKIDGEYKVAQYGQWDGYPSGQGRDVLTFLKGLTPDNLEAFKDKCRNLRWISDKALAKMWIKAGANADGTISIENANAFGRDYPQFSRDTGAGILSLIKTSDNLRLENSIDFVADSAFCEWVYVIDFDTNTFEVFEGFQEEPLNASDRFYAYMKKGDNDGYPARLKALWYLNELPDVGEFPDLVKMKFKAESREHREARKALEAVRVLAETAKARVDAAKAKADDEAFRKIVEENSDIRMRPFV